MGIRILLIAREGETRKKYQEAITDLGVETVVVSSLKKIDRALMDLSYHGAMVDMRTKIEILKDENELVYTVLRKFPVAHLNLESKTGEIRLFIQDKKPERHWRTLLIGNAAPSPHGYSVLALGNKSISM